MSTPSLTKCLQVSLVSLTITSGKTGLGNPSPPFQLAPTGTYFTWMDGPSADMVGWFTTPNSTFWQLLSSSPGIPGRHIALWRKGSIPREHQSRIPSVWNLEKRHWSTHHFVGLLSPPSHTRHGGRVLYTMGDINRNPAWCPGDQVNKEDQNSLERTLKIKLYLEPDPTHISQGWLLLAKIQDIKLLKNYTHC